MLLAPFLREEGPALVVAPAATDLQIARREALATEAGALGECDRGAVAGLDVGLDPVQAQGGERPAQDELDPFSHIPIAGVGLPGGVAEVGALKGATDDLR